MNGFEIVGEFFDGRRKKINDATAAAIAAALCQGPAMRVFSTTGGIADVSEIRAELTALADGIAARPGGLGWANRIQVYACLVALDCYVSRWKRRRKAPAGWVVPIVLTA